MPFHSLKHAFLFVCFTQLFRLFGRVLSKSCHLGHILIHILNVFMSVDPSELRFEISARKENCVRY